jgi:hypothetical protein
MQGLLTPTTVCMGETNVDKVASRTHALETNLKLFTSTTVDMHKTSYNLKQNILDSEQNLKNALQHTHSKP